MASLIAVTLFTMVRAVGLSRCIFISLNPDSNEDSINKTSAINVTQDSLK